MTKKTTPTQADLLNVIRDNAGADYQATVPKALDNPVSLSLVGDAITSYPQNKNEFLNVLMNKVLAPKYMNKAFINKYNMFNRGKLPYGQSLEFIFTELLATKDFTPEHTTDDIFSKNVPNQKVQYITENFRKSVKLSISEIQLKNAVYSSEGLMSLIQNLQSILVSSMEKAEYTAYRSIFMLPDKYKKVTVTEPVDKATTEEFVIKVKTMIEKLSFPSNKYNMQEVETWSDAKDLYLVMTPELKARIDVSLLATAFNMSKAEVEAKIVLVDEFEVEGRQALLIDKDFLQFYITADNMDSVKNPVGLYTNYFYNRWATISICEFANAISFDKE